MKHTQLHNVCTHVNVFLQYLWKFRDNESQVLFEVLRSLHISFLIQRIQVTERSHTHLVKERVLFLVTTEF